MEAIAEFDFTATDTDEELSFRKGAMLKVLEMDEDEHWFRADLDGKEGFVPKNYLRLRPCPWFVGRVPSAELTEKLKKKSPGSFLIRHSQTQKGDYAISVREGESATPVQHYRIKRDRGFFSVWDIAFHSLNELIDYYSHNSISRLSDSKLRLPRPEPRPPQSLNEPSASSGTSSTRYQTVPSSSPPPPSVSESSPASAQPKGVPQPIVLAHHDSIETPEASPKSPMDDDFDDDIVQAMFDFEADEPGDLPLRRGDLIRVTGREASGWAEGTHLSNGQSGSFPESYVVSYRRASAHKGGERRKVTSTSVGGGAAAKARKARKSNGS